MPNTYAFAAAAVALWIIAMPFTSFSLVDSDQPTVPPSSLSFLFSQAIITAIGTSALYFYFKEDDRAITMTMLFVGALFSVATVDPNNVKRNSEESFKSYALRYLVERIRRKIVHKIFVYGSAIIALYSFPQYWYLVVLLLALHVHYYKMTNCITSEAGCPGPWAAKKEIQQKWATRAVPAGLVLGFLVGCSNIAFSEFRYIPDRLRNFDGPSTLEALAGLGCSNVARAVADLGISGLMYALTNMFNSNLIHTLAALGCPGLAHAIAGIAGFIFMYLALLISGMSSDVIG